MADRDIRTAMIGTAHLPSLLLVIGYPVFWFELYLFRQPGGHTTGLAAGLFLLLSLSVIWKQAAGCKDKLLIFRQRSGREALPAWFLWLVIALAGILLMVAAWAALLPPHLLQEFDYINYHLGLPRQHLLTGSFAHLAWSSADLFVLPVDFALAPYWLATDLPNKYPQFLFLLGLAGVAGRLIYRFSQGKVSAVIVGVAAVLSLNVLGVQAGTGMLDVVLCYLFFAALDSLLSGNPWLAGIEFAFFVWAKPLLPSLFLLIAVGMLAAGFFFKQWKEDCSGYPWKKAFVSWLAATVIVAGPFMAKSWEAARTPLYPMTAAILKPGACPAGEGRLSELERNSCAWKGVRDNYGHGHSLGALIKHFWLLAVPERGVNNAYDYPLGLTYLLLLYPFALMLWQGCRSGNMSPLIVFVVIYWGLWFGGCQQSRFLMVPLVAMAIAVFSRQQAFSRVLLACLCVSLALTVLSVWRAHRQDFGRPVKDILRIEDRRLLEMAQSVTPGEMVELSRADVGFASFKVKVNQPHDLFVLNGRPLGAAAQ